MAKKSKSKPTPKIDVDIQEKLHNLQQIQTELLLILSSDSKLIEKKELLTKLLLRLDTILSNNDNVIKTLRKNLVDNINRELDVIENLI